VTLGRSEFELPPYALQLMEADTVAATEDGEREDGVEQSARARSKRVVNKQESNVRDLRLSFRRSAGTISRGK